MTRVYVTIVPLALVLLYQKCYKRTRRHFKTCNHCVLEIG